MNTFTAEQSEAIKARVEEILKDVKEGQATRDIMAEIYTDAFGDEEKEQGEHIADRILDEVRSFDQDYREAQDDLERYIDEFQQSIDEGKSCVERCNYWLKIGAAVAAATKIMGEEDADRESLLREIEQMSVPPESATEYLEEELRNKAKEAIKNSGVMVSSIIEQAEVLKGVSDADESARFLVGLGGKAVEYRAIAAMLAYTKIKSGEFDTIPEDMTPEQVAILICAEMEQMRILDAVGKGNIAVDVASMLLFILGAVVIVKFTVALWSAGVTLAAGLFGNLLIIPAVIVLGAGMFRILGNVLEMWSADSRAIVEAVATAVSAIVKGASMVINFTAHSVVPEIVRLAKDIYGKMRKNSTESENVENTENEVDTEDAEVTML